MKAVTHRFNRVFSVFLLLGGISCAFPIQAASYEFTIIDYPGTEAGFTSISGINNKGEIVGTASVDNISFIPFVYNIKKKVFTPLPNAPGGLNTFALGINEPGVVVGSAGDETFTSGTILDKGAFTIFSHPGSSFTEARAISNSGLVTGYANDTAANLFGFIYDSAANGFIDFLPSPVLTIAQGINGRGQVVGGVFLDANEAYLGSPAGHYGFLREKRGSITLFRVNDVVARSGTRARGITDSGRITGFFFDPATANFRGFVTPKSLARAPGFQSLTIPASGLLDVPGAANTFPQGIDNSGRIAGGWSEADGTSRGFLATPLKKGKKK